MRSRRWRVAAVFVTLGALACGVLGGLVAYAALTLPDITAIGKTTGTIKILDVHNQLIAEVGLNAQTRTTVTLDKVSPYMQDAILAAEDRNFYNEGALDVPRIGKALLVDVVLRRPLEGASTITQQLAKQAFFGEQAEKSALRKLREALLAKEIDDTETKAQILEKYLNITYFGENAYGIENASTRYFGKHASDLTIAESALLAGLVQAPSAYDPYKNPDAAFDRMHYVLGGLVAMGKLTQAKADAVDPEASNATVAKANRVALQTDLSHGQTNLSGIAPHFAQYVQDQLRDEFADNPSELQGNLTVYTTLDLTIQAKATAAVQAGVLKLQRYGANNAALLMLDASTGGILAMVGSADFTNDAIAGQFNVTTAQRRPGSSFKPYVYETGFINGTLKPSSILDDTAQESRNLGGVQDFDNSYMGRITAATSLLNSRNISTEQAMEIAGVSNVLNFAQTLGISSPLAANASTAIGTSAIKMTDHASAYAAFANGGHKVAAHGILKVVDANGTEFPARVNPAALGTVMTPQQAWTMTNILRGYAKHWNLPFKYDTAGKSGTTDNFVDAWYMVYTPDWVVATWAGHTSGTDPAEQPMDGLYGTTEATYIAAPFVNSLSPPTRFTPVTPTPQDCSAGGNELPDGCPTPTPSPTPVATPAPTPIPTPIPTAPPTACPSPAPVISPGPTPTAPPTPCP